MCASSGTKLLSMNEAVSSSLYDSASSRAHPPQAGAALKSISKGFFCVLASASAASASVNQCTFISILLFGQSIADLSLKFCAFCSFCGLKGDGLFGPELEFAVFVDFGFGLQAARDLDHVFKHALTNFIDRLGS